jgi:hypothetical protein
MEPGRHVSTEALQAVQSETRTQDAAVHLLQIIERQPACLMRVDLEGQFLAVNQAGLSLLGAEGLSEVLGTNVAGRISTTNSGHWTEFAQRVWNGGPGSLECSLMRGPSGVRTILFHAIALPDHPDQIPSLLLTARDLSDSRTNDAMAAELAEARAALDERRRHFESTLEEQKARGTQLENDLRSERARRQQLESALDETRQLQATLDESKARAAEQYLELKSLREDAQQLEPLAVIGRLAFAVSDDIQTCLASAESCARRLLAQNTCGDTEQVDLEVLRRDLAQAARLLRQAARLGAKP